MKGKKYTIGDKIRMLREANCGRSIGEICKDKNISEVTFHRADPFVAPFSVVLNPFISHG